MKYLIEIAKEVGKELKTGALVMLTTFLIGVPLVLVALYLPTWVCFTVMALALFGQAVAKVAAKARASTAQQGEGEKP